MQDKPWETMIRMLDPYAESWAFMAVPTTRRSWQPAMHWTLLPEPIRRRATVLSVEDIAEWMRGVGTPILVVGSLYLVGWIRAHLPMWQWQPIRHPMVHT